MDVILLDDLWYFLLAFIQHLCSYNSKISLQNSITIILVGVIWERPVTIPPISTWSLTVFKVINFLGLGHVRWEKRDCDCSPSPNQKITNYQLLKHHHLHSTSLCWRFTMTKGTSSFGKRHNKSHTVLSLSILLLTLFSCADDAVTAHCTFKNTLVPTVAIPLPKSENVPNPLIYRLKLKTDLRTTGVPRQREERQREREGCDTSRLWLVDSRMDSVRWVLKGLCWLLETGGHATAVASQPGGEA